MTTSKLSTLTLTLILLFVVQNTYTQNASKQQNRQSLYNFAQQRNIDWKYKKQHADSVFNSLCLPVRIQDSIGTIIEIQNVSPNQVVFYSTENINAAHTISTSNVWVKTINETNIWGNNTSALIWDGGMVNSEHQEFIANAISRVIQRDDPAITSNHSTHISGTVAAKGIDVLAHGMAPASKIYAYDYNNDIAEIASEAADGSLISNHSYGVICGWRYDLTNEMWYWHGDYSISSTEDVKFGLYDSQSHDIDYILYNAPKYSLVKSAGNDKNDCPESQPILHLIWDEQWVSSSDYHEADGGDDGYDCLSSMAVAKNNLVVGGVEDLPDGYTKPADVVINSFSSWGPTDDGRIKPDIVSNGAEVYSCTAESNSSYQSLNGTSMAAASITGSILLLHETQQLVQPEVFLNSATIKGLLIHTADECGNTPGPDYKFGWGLANIENAVDLLIKNSESGGENLLEKQLLNNTSYTKTVTVPPSTDSLKITLCWTDPPADPSTYSLNPIEPQLINDLNLSITKTTSEEIFYPWVLNPSIPSNAASKGINSRDNVEQVYIENPEPGEYTLTINHEGELTNNLQDFSLIITGIETNEAIFPPSNLSFNSGNEYVSLKFHPPSGLNHTGFNIYRNGELLTFLADTFYVDTDLENNNSYQYYVVAVYSNNIESIPSNTIVATPRQPISIPYTCSFDDNPDDWTLKHSISGWRHGNSDSLDSYYLDFSANSSNFIAIDSYSAYEGVHTSDFAVSPPFNLSNCENVTLSFDYHFVTGIYGSIDELKLVYRTTGQENWTTIFELSRNYNWESFETEIPVEALSNNVVFGLYYDDLYKWGKGAGVDNFAISGECDSELNIDILPKAISEPLSDCSLTNEETVTVELQNIGEDNLAEGAIINLSLQINNNSVINETIQLTENLDKDSSLSYSFHSLQNFENTGYYNIEISASYIQDINPFNDTLTAAIQNFGYPEPVILGLELGYCKSDDMVGLTGTPYGGIFSGIGITDTILHLADLPLGENIITYSYTDQNNCSADTNYSVFIFINPQPEITMNDTQVCAETNSIAINCEPEGGILYGNGVVGSYFFADYELIGDNWISYSIVDENGCSGIDSLHIEVVALPFVELTSPVEAVCMSGSPFQLSLLPIGGELVGNGIIGNSFYPEYAEIGDNRISYEVESSEGCLASDSITITVLESEAIQFIDPVDKICDNSDPIVLQATPSGGIFSGPGIADSLFSPSITDIGEQIIKYELDDYCNSDSITITVLESTEAFILQSDISTCSNDSALLIEAQPDQGYFVPDIIVESYLSPSDLEIGTNTLSYFYTNENNCMSKDSVHIFVFESPQTQFLNLDTIYCENDTPFELFANPIGGTFIGNGIDGNNFYPANADIGENIISYSFESLEGCSSTESIKISILESTEVNILLPDTSICSNSPEFLIEATPDQGFFVPDIITDSYLSASDLEIGTNTLSYFYTNENNCMSKDSVEILLNASPQIQFLNLDSSYCMNHNPIKILVSPLGGTFIGNCMQNDSIYPSQLEEGSHSLEYTVANNMGCIDTSIWTIKIYPAPYLFIGKDTSISNDCSLIICPETDAQYFSWYDGSQSSIKEIFASDLQIGENLIYLSVENNYGCVNIDSMRVIVQENSSFMSKEAETNEITILPNPASNYFYIKSSSKLKPIKSVSIYKLNGNLIKTFSHPTREVYKIDFLEPSLYLIKVNTANGMFVSKLIKK